MEHKVHEGRNVKRFREMLGIKQEALAFELGDDWNQKKVSLLEQKEVLEPDVLYMVAKVLNIPERAIKNFDEEQAVNIIANTFSLDNGSIFNANNQNPIFNPLDAILRLHDEKIALYERMLAEKGEMMVKLEKLIQMK
ncbi:helix-turn-helix domain-containing protein [Polluticaenibacter yanchengensis]|uniref:Helix-turn-helix transcriptional regulator n=1 Tax=Polluticaenibacter yanchengensis TaxID=3014562 RepID=A0ABT4UNL5_9BACT|nr:helix-turn-helix transcriptional regulator [Chitinophagaceae bacterium LY-5]